MSYDIRNLSDREMMALTKRLEMYRYKGLLNYKRTNDLKYNIKLFEEAKGYEPNLSQPKTFSEKLLYLKLHYRNPLETLCSDKYHVSEYVKACGYEDILKKIYFVTRDACIIPYETLPDRFFLRCNHMSGFNYALAKDEIKAPVAVGKFFNTLMKINWYHHGREWNYKNIDSLVLCEEYLCNPDDSPLVDYKFYCFSGEPKYIMVSLGEYEHNVRNHKFDMRGNSIDYHFKKKPTLDERDAPIPDNLDKMIEIVKELCKPFPHVRVDLYSIDGRIIFGELTFYSNGGVVNLVDKDYEEEIGSWIDLEKYRTDMIL